VTGVWITIGALALATVVLRLAGPLLLGGRPLPEVAMTVIELLASALLAALVVVETLGNGRSLSLDARALGVAFAAVALAKRATVMFAVLGSAVVAAAVRALT
jgi:uncharacterized membrane protein